MTESKNLEEIRAKFETRGFNEDASILATAFTYSEGNAAKLGEFILHQDDSFLRELKDKLLDETTMTFLVDLMNEKHKNLHKQGAKQNLSPSKLIVSIIANGIQQYLNNHVANMESEKLILALNLQKELTELLN